MRMLWESSPPSMVTVTFQGYVAIAAKVHVTVSTPHPSITPWNTQQIAITFQGCVAITAKVHVIVGISALDFRCQNETSPLQHRSQSTDVKSNADCWLSTAHTTFAMLA